jgi:hypothetical protein
VQHELQREPSGDRVRVDHPFRTAAPPVDLGEGT